MSNKLFLGSIWRTQSAHSDTQLELECISKFTINIAASQAPLPNATSFDHSLASSGLTLYVSTGLNVPLKLSDHPEPLRLTDTSLRQLAMFVPALRTSDAVHHRSVVHISSYSS